MCSGLLATSHLQNKSAVKWLDFLCRHYAEDPVTSLGGGVTCSVTQPCAVGWRRSSIISSPLGLFLLINPGTNMADSACSWLCTCSFRRHCSNSTWLCHHRRAQPNHLQSGYVDLCSACPQSHVSLCPSIETTLKQIRACRAFAFHWKLTYCKAEPGCALLRLDRDTSGITPISVWSCHWRNFPTVGIV